MDIEDKIAIVTGGTGGIGFATVQELLRNGAKFTAILDVEATKNRAYTCLQKVESEFGRGRAAYYACDVTKRKEFEDVYDNLVKSQGQIDILINNAGIINDLLADLMIDINLKGVINCALVAIKRMGKHNGGKGGCILNTASVVGLTPSAGMPIYSATKYGVCGFTKSLKDHFEYTGVRMIAICPGVTQTNFLEQDWRKQSLPFVQDKFLDQLLHCSDVIQPPENVALAIIKMLKKAEPGALWVSDVKELPYEVEDPPLYKNRRIQV